jgi:hypothetical protein
MAVSRQPKVASDRIKHAWSDKTWFRWKRLRGRKEQRLFQRAQDEDKNDFSEKQAF